MPICVNLMQMVLIFSNNNIKCVKIDTKQRGKIRFNNNMCFQ